MRRHFEEVRGAGRIDLFIVVDLPTERDVAERMFVLTHATALHSIVSREVAPLDAALITVGTLHAGTMAIVIPQSATLSGSVRTFDQRVRELLAD